jgi:hypothetical protein
MYKSPRQKKTAPIGRFFLARVGGLVYLAADNATQRGAAKNSAGIATNHATGCAADSRTNGGVALRRGQAVASAEGRAQREQKDGFANYGFHGILL